MLTALVSRGYRKPLCTNSMTDTFAMPVSSRKVPSPPGARKPSEACSFRGQRLEDWNLNKRFVMHEETKKLRLATEQGFFLRRKNQQERCVSGSSDA